MSRRRPPRHDQQLFIDVRCKAGHFVGRFHDRGLAGVWSDGQFAPALAFPNRWSLDASLQISGGPLNRATGLRRWYDEMAPMRTQRRLASRTVAVASRWYVYLVCPCARALVPVEVKDAALTAARATGVSLMGLEDIAAYALQQ